jgi:hypothetical protein
VYKLPIGLALINIKYFDQEDKRKGVLESSYPEQFNISRSLINKITNIVSEDSQNHVNVKKYNYSNDKVIFVNQKIIDKENMEIIVLILNLSEIGDPKNIEKSMQKLEKTSIDFYNLKKLKSQRILEFDVLASKFYIEKASKKILIIGFAGAGKTCIKKVFFEGEDPKKLLSELGSPEPTFGVQHYNYSWLDTEIGTVDSSGQEFERYISGDSFEREITFGSSDTVIYVFDINNWLNEREKVIENLKKIITTRDEIAPNAKLYSFCHKIDLITENTEKRAGIFSDIKKQLQTELNIKTVFTSIEPKYIHTLFRSLQIILNDLSKVGSVLESFLKDILNRMDSTSIILFDKELKIISERRSGDISVSFIENAISFMKAAGTFVKNIDNSDILDYGIISSQNKTVVLMKRIENAKFGISFIIIASKSASKKILTKVVDLLEEKVTSNVKKAPNSPPLLH